MENERDRERGEGSGRKREIVGGRRDGRKGKEGEVDRGREKDGAI